MLDFAVCLWLFIIGINLKNWISGFTAYEKNVLNKMLFWHIAVGIGFIWYLSISGGGDAYTYWSRPKLYGWNYVVERMEAGSASGYVYFINYLPSKVLELSFFTGSMFYVLLGFGGFVFLMKIIKENVPGYLSLRQVTILGIPIFPAILFLPNLHFWTSGLGKDTILFFSIVIFVYALFDFRNRIFLIITAILLSVFIRPHMLLFLFMAVGIAAVLDGKLQVYQKLVLYIIFAGIMVVLLPKVMEFTQLESLEAESIDTFASSKASSLNKEGAGSGIDISNYPYPLKIFTFLFRPLFFDMQGILGLVASIENLIYLVFAIKIMKNKPMRAFRSSGLPLKSILIFFIIGSLVFPLILGNLGIILRQKTPFILMFLVFGFWVLVSNKRNEKLNIEEPA